MGGGEEVLMIQLQKNRDKRNFCANYTENLEMI